jgi:hypothetical protein
MVVKVSKPELNLREKISELDKPSGVAGEAMLRAETPQEQFNLIGAGRRNLLINGGFDVWQRATSNTTNSGFRSVDRWSFNTYTGGAFTVSKETDSTFGNVLKWRRTTADTSNTNAGNCIQQSIENAKYLVKGKSVTVSFWLKNEKTVLRSGFVRFRINVSPYTHLAPAQYWESSGNEWEYHSLTFETSETVNSDHIELQIQMDNGSSMGAMYIAQCQFELGKVATPFEHRSYGEELALCQRYYLDLSAHQSGQSFEKLGMFQGSNNTTSGFTYTQFPVTMRARPSLVVSSTASHYGIYQGSDIACTSVPTLNSNCTKHNGVCIISASGLEAKGSGIFQENSNSGALLAFNAEL